MNIRNWMALACTTLALSNTPALAQTNMKMASATQPGSVLIGVVDEMVDKINKGSNGALKTERLFVASEQEITSQVARGRVEMALISYTGTSVLIPEAAVLNMPYVWKSEGERDFVTDNHALPVLKKIFDTKGLVLIGLADVGWNDVVCKTACLTPADVKGLKVRVSPAPASKMFWGSLGTNGVQMPLSELFPALQSGLVEAADLPFLYYITTPAAQSTPHYVMTRHLHHGSTIVVNKGVWNKLSPEQQKLVHESRPDIAKVRKDVADTEKPKMAEFKAKGGFVHELTPAQRAEWAKLVEPNQQKVIDEIGGQSAELWAAIQKGKQEYAARGGK